MGAITASTKFCGIRPDGEEIVIHLEIGTPYLRAKYSYGDWACPISLTPLYKELAEATGIDPFHSLCLASSLALDLLQGFIDDGGRILHDDGTDVLLQAYAFGVANKGASSAA
ncbi:MAG: hypothetical protein WA049_01735 [Ferribacterium limneticum]|jgi:hypothetical protein